MKDMRFTNYDELPLMLSVADAANALGVSKVFVYNLVKSGDFPSLHVGHRILIPKDDFIEWVKGNTNSIRQE